jgi:hypothetical protein
MKKKDVDNIKSEANQGPLIPPKKKVGKVLE